MPKAVSQEQRLANGRNARSSTGPLRTSHLYSTFRIPHSQFTQCHRVTLPEKTVLAKRTHLTPWLY
jgi:hypothetical protein